MSKPSHLTKGSLARSASTGKPITLADWLWYMVYGSVFTYDQNDFTAAEIIATAKAAHRLELEEIKPGLMKVVATEGGLEELDPGMHDRSRIAHKSYVMVSLSRTSGGTNGFFGSSINPGSWVTLRVHEAELDRDGLYHSKVRSRHMLPLMEVRMTPMQFAELITNMNVGDGVPGTLSYVGRERVRYMPAKKLNFRQEAERTFSEAMGDLAKRFDEYEGQLEEILGKQTIGKADRAKLRNLVSMVKSKLTGTMPFAEEMLYEAAQKTVLEAKAEIDGTLTTAMLKLGGEELARRLTDGALPGSANDILALDTGDDQGE